MLNRSTAMAQSEPSFVIVGCGAIGAFIGLLLDQAGHRVRFLQRKSHTAEAQLALLSKIGLVGLCSTDPEFRVEIQAERINAIFTTDPHCLNECSYVLVTTKRTANDAVVKQLVKWGTSCPVAFLQNGMRIHKDLGEVPFEVIETVVNFNVVYDAASGVATLSQLMKKSHLVFDGEKPSAEGLAKLLSKIPIDVSARAPLLSVQAGKLLLNMTNAVNALSGAALLPMFTEPSYRFVLAASVAEARQVFTTAGITPTGITAEDNFQLKFSAQLLLAPQWFFMATAGGKLKGRGNGYTSMAQDLNAHRVPTEIDFLNGEVVRMGEEKGVYTPVNKAIIAAVKEAEAQNTGCPKLTGDELMVLTGVRCSGAVGRTVFNLLVMLFLVLVAGAVASACRSML